MLFFVVVVAIAVAAVPEQLHLSSLCTVRRHHGQRAGSSSYTHRCVAVRRRRRHRAGTVTSRPYAVVRRRRRRCHAGEVTRWQCVAVLRRRDISSNWQPQNLPLGCRRCGSRWTACRN